MKNSYDKELLEKYKMYVAISKFQDKKVNNRTNEYPQKNIFNRWRAFAMKKRIALATTLSVFLISGVVFATNMDTIKEFLNSRGLGRGIDSAIEQGYIANPEMDYIGSEVTVEKNPEIVLDNIKADVKIGNFMMDDLNLSTQFNFKFDDKIKDYVDIDNLHNITLNDLIVIDEENRIIFCGANKETFEKFCKKNELDYVFGEFNENYMNCGLNCFPAYHDKENNSVILNYNMYTDGFPKSKNLNFYFEKILLTENENSEGEAKEILLQGNWQIDVDVPEKMYNRQTIPYSVVSCSNKDFYITSAFVSDTGFEIGIIIDNMEKPENYLQILSEEIKKEIGDGKISESEIEDRRNFLLNTPKYQNIIKQSYPIEDTPHTEIDIESIYDTSYIENERGEIFVKSLSPSRKQNNDFIEENKFSYYETFELTKYEITNRLKMQIMFKGEPVIIELEKK